MMALQGMFQQALPDFQPVSEGIMACLASRPEDWQFWELVDARICCRVFKKNTNQQLKERRFLLSRLNLQTHNKLSSGQCYYYHSASSAVETTLCALKGLEQKTSLKRAFFEKNILSCLAAHHCMDELSAMIERELLEKREAAGGAELRCHLFHVTMKNSAGVFIDRAFVMRWELRRPTKRIFFSSLDEIKSQT